VPCDERLAAARRAAELREHFYSSTDIDNGFDTNRRGIGRPFQHQALELGPTLWRRVCVSQRHASSRAEIKAAHWHRLRQWLAPLIVLEAHRFLRQKATQAPHELRAPPEPIGPASRWLSAAPKVPGSPANRSPRAIVWRHPLWKCFWMAGPVGRIYDAFF
jgi:hypothetical protein